MHSHVIHCTLLKCTDHGVMKHAHTDSVRAGYILLQCSIAIYGYALKNVFPAYIRRNVSSQYCNYIYTCTYADVCLEVAACRALCLCILISNNVMYIKHSYVADLIIHSSL